MRIAVVGAGAVGGYYGARLAQAGNEVVFIARGANLEAIRQRGIRVRSSEGNIEIPVRAESDPNVVGPVELVLYAVKTYSNPDALRLLPPLVSQSGAAVLTLQNGVESASELAAAVGEQAVLGGCTYIMASLEEPGLVEYLPPNRRIVFGEAFGERRVTPRVAHIQQVLVDAGIKAEGVADYRIAVWEKFIFLAPLAGLAGAARVPLGALQSEAASRGAVALAMSELEALARAEGVAVAPDIVARNLRFFENTNPASRPSLMLDIVAGRPIEVEALIGAAVRIGRVRGIPTPVMETLYGILKPHQTGAR